MNWTGSGNTPSGVLLDTAGVALLSDLVIRACAANPKDAAIGPAIESIPIPPTYTAVVNRAAMEADRDSLRAAAAACGVKSKHTPRDLKGL